MNNKNMFSINWINIKSALISVLLTAALAVFVYMVSLGDIFKVNGHDLVNIAALSIMTGLISLIKAFLTSDKGNFLGVTKINPTDTK